MRSWGSRDSESTFSRRGFRSALFPLWCACLLLGLWWCRSFGCVEAPSEMPLMSLSSFICPGCRAFLPRFRAFWYTPVVCLFLACLKRKVRLFFGAPPCLPSVRDFFLRLHLLFNVSRFCDFFAADLSRILAIPMSFASVAT